VNRKLRTSSINENPIGTIRFFFSTITFRQMVHYPSAGYNENKCLNVCGDECAEFSKT